MGAPEIREITDFSKARKNPYAERIRKEGFSITVHYSSDDVAKMTNRTIEKIDRMESMGWFDLDPDEIEALNKYRQANKT